MAFSAMEALQAFGLGRQMRQQDVQLERQERQYQRQEQGRMRAGEQVRSGDFTGAAATAFEIGDDELLGSVQKLNQAQQGQLVRETQAGLAAIEALSAIPDDAQRTAMAQRLAPQLRAAGFDEAELTDYMQDLSIPTLQARKSYLTRIASGMQTGRAAQPTSMQRNYEWLRSINPTVANRYLSRQGDRQPLVVQDGLGGYRVIPREIVQGGDEDTGAPDELTDDEIEALGGQEQPAPGGFPSNSFVDPNAGGGW